MTVEPRDHYDEVLDLPRSIESEIGLLGGVMGNNTLFESVARVVKAEHFFDPFHRRVFECMTRLADASRMITPHGLVVFLGDYEVGEGVTVAGLLAKMAAEGFVTKAHVMDAARTIKELHDRRRLIDTANQLKAVAYDAPIEARPSQIAAQVIEDLDAIVQAADTTNYRMSVGAALQSTIDAVQAHRDGKEVAGTTTGFAALDNKLGPMRPGDLVILAGRPGMGKAQPLHSKIRVPGGWKTMASINIGDQISSADGEASCVTGVFPQGQKEVFLVTLSDGRTAEACADHLWEVVYRDWDAPRVLRTAKIAVMLQRARYQRRLSIRMINGDLADHGVEMPVDAWLLGALIGNGTFTCSPVRFSTADEFTLEKVRSLVPEAVKVKPGGEFCYRLVTPMGQDNPLLTAIRSLGLYGKRSPEKFIPDQYKVAARQVRLALLQGLMDTDGWAEKNGTVCYATASPQLCADIVELARSLGYWAKSTVGPAYVFCGGERHQKHDSYRVTLTGRGIEEVFSLPRKKDRVASRSWFRALTIQSVKSVGVYECQCISVSHPSKTYVTDNYVVTHNTATVLEIAYNCALRDEVVPFFSLEMSAEDSANRIASSWMLRNNRPAIPYKIISDPKSLSDAQFEQVIEAKHALAHLRIEIDAQPALSLTQISARARRFKQRADAHGLRIGAMVIDHLGIMSPPRGAPSREREVAMLSGGLKQLAKELSVPLIVLCQLSRKIEERKIEDRRPRMEDLRESGAIEQDADIVLGVYREAYYLAQLPNPSDTESARLNSVRNDLEIGIMKNRRGSGGRARLRCYIASNRIMDAAEDTQDAFALDREDALI